MRLLQQFKIPALLFLAAQLPGVATADVTWAFNTSNCISTMGPTGNCGSGTINFADYRTYGGTGGADAVTVSGWANTAGANDSLGLGQITHWSGLGVRNADAPAPVGDGSDAGEGISPEHAVDNDQRFDLVLFDFGIGNSVALTNIGIGYVAGDADISLLAFEGGSPGDTPDLAGVGYTETSEGLTGNGWTLVNNYDLSPDANLRPVNPDPDGAGPASRTSSRYWIVAAHNNVFGVDCVYDPVTSTKDGCPNNNDAFKISLVKGIHLRPPGGNGVPLPPTFLLTTLGLAWFARKQLVSA